MKQRAQELVARGDKLFADRYPIMSLWQQIAENFHIMRADFTRRRYISEEFASYLMTGRPAMAHRDLSNSLPALMRPRDRQWLWARTHDERINEDRDSRTYLDWLSRQQFRAMYDQRSGFVRATKEADGDYCAFGNAVLTVDPNISRDGLLIRCWHLRDVVWADDFAQKIVEVHHKRKIAARDVKRLWPKTYSKDLDITIEKNPNQEISCRRIVVPIDEYDLPVRNKARTPFVSIYIETEHNTVLEEKAVTTMGYVIPRWATVSGSQYAYSPSCVYGLPDARMMQQITLTMLEASQKATDPPMIAVGEAINGGVNSGAGMITWTEADYDERTGEVLRPMQMRFDGIQFGAAREQRVEGMLDATFFLNQLRIPQITKEMTAYEASKLYEEFTRSSLPLLEPIEVEYNGGLCTAVYEIMWNLGLFGSPADMPPMLRGQELRWEFNTPLKAASETAKVFSFNNTVDITAKAAQIKPDVVLNIDVDAGYRAAVTGAGGAEWLVKPEVVDQARQQNAQQQQAAAAAAAMGHGADVATRMATAVKSAADAGQAVKGLGGGTSQAA